MLFLSLPTYWILPITFLWLMLLIFGSKKQREFAILGLMVFLLSDFLSSRIKVIINSPRPYRFLSNVRVLTGISASSGFPSSHVSNLIAVSTPLFFYHRVLGGLLFLFSLAVGYSRVYLGVHYPSDVIGGGCVGFLIGWCLSELVFWIKKK